MALKEDRQARVPVDEEYATWTLLNQVNDGMFKARDNELRAFGVSAVQVGVMYALKNTGEPTPSEIARWVSREPHTISASLDRMEKQGLVNCARTKQGRRQVRVELTEKGEEVFRSQHRKRRAIGDVLGCLSPEERKQFRVCLEKLRQKTLEVLMVKPPFP